jgi:hypothetical protein
VHEVHDHQERLTRGNAQCNVSVRCSQAREGRTSASWRRDL